MIGVTLRYKWIPCAMFVGPGLEPVLPSGRLSCLAPSLLGMVSEKGESFSFHNASNGRIEDFWSPILAFLSKHTTWADFMDRAPWWGTNRQI